MFFLLHLQLFIIFLLQLGRQLLQRLSLSLPRRLHLNTRNEGRLLIIAIRLKRASDMFHTCLLHWTHVWWSKSLMMQFAKLDYLSSWLLRNNLICINLISPLISARDVGPGLPAVSGSGSRPGQRPAPSPSPEVFAVLSHRCSSDSSAPLSCPFWSGSSPGGISAQKAHFTYTSKPISAVT